MKNLDLNFLYSELNRVIDLVKFSDKKSGFISVYYSIVLGSLISNKDLILGFINTNCGWNLYIYLFILSINILSFCIGLFFVFRSVFPRLKNMTTDKSLFYFGHIADLKFIDYLNNLKHINEADIKEQIAEQIHANSIIVNKKMKNTQRSIKILFTSVATLVIIMAF